MIRAGVDVVRVNFSHGKAQDHIDRATLVREVARRAGREVAIMADLQGPKIRVGKFDGDKTLLAAGQKFILDGATTELGTNERVGLDYKELPRDLRAGDVLLLNDGLLKLVVDAVRARGGPHHGRGRRRVVQQQGHQQGRWRPDGAGADRERHGRHQDPR